MVVTGGSVEAARVSAALVAGLGAVLSSSAPADLALVLIHVTRIVKSRSFVK